MKKTDTIFDLAQPDLTNDQKGYIELAARAPEPKEKSFLNDVKDYAKTALKGTVEGVSRLGQMVSPAPIPREVRQMQLEQQTEKLNELLPTEDTFGERALRRGLREAPSALAFPGASAEMAVRALTAGFVGEGAKELGAPEWAQTALEITTYLGPDVTKKLLEKGSNASIIQKAREMGLSDKQITPLLQPEFKTKWLSKLTPKRGSTQTSLESTHQGLSDIYSNLRKSGKAALEISEKENGRLVNNLKHFIDDMPDEVRGKIMKDYQDLIGNKITGASLINFWKDINQYLSPKTKQLANLKKPIGDALKSISPELAEDFRFVNDLYGRYYKISAKLKPNLVSDLISAGEALGLTGSLITGNYPYLAGFVSEKAARQIAKNLLLNPHFQQLGSKMAVAINQGKFQLAKKIIEEYANKIKPYSEEGYKKLNEMTDEDIEKLLSIGQQKTVE